MSKMLNITAEEATVLSTFGYEQEEEGYVLCYPKGELTHSQEEVISTLVNKEILLPGDDKEDPYFWMHQSDYRVLYDLTDGFKRFKLGDVARAEKRVRGAKCSYFLKFTNGKFVSMKYNPDGGMMYSFSA